MLGYSDSNNHLTQMYEDCLNSSYLYLRIDNSTRFRYIFLLKYRKYLYTYKDITIHIIFEDDQVISHDVGGKCLVYVYGVIMNNIL